jgi:regulatory protein
MAAHSRSKKLDAEGLWSYALHTLARKAYSAQELKLKLSQRSQSAADLNATLAKLREYGLADDRKFSEAFAVSRMQNQGFGRLRVLRDLRSKRVASTIAGQAVERAFSGTDEQQLIQQFLERKYRGKNLSDFLAEEKNLVSAYRRLRAAGFRGDSSLAVLKRYTRRAEEWSGMEEEE